MFLKISDFITYYSRGWVALLGLVIFLLFTALVLPSQAAKSATVENVGTPDLSLWYSPGELYQMAEGYGEQGRRDYIQARLRFDIVWPLVYTFFLATSLSWLFGHSAVAGSLWRYANLAPLIAMLLDFCENISTSLVMHHYPASSPVMATLAPIFTLLKWIFVSGSFVLLLIGGWLVIKRRAPNS